MANLLDSSREPEVMAHSREFTEQLTERRSARSYFLEEQEKLMDSFIEQSLDIFKKTGEVFESRYISTTTELNQSRGGDLQRLLGRCTKQFEAYCLLKKKVDYKKEVIANFSRMIYEKNWLRTVLAAWRAQKDKMKHLKRMDEKAESYNQKRMMKSVLKSWHGVMMQENRTKIRNNVMRKTEQQLTRVTKEYEKIIEDMERTLSLKLIELKKEEDEHKLLHDKYEAMYNRKKVEVEAPQL